MSRYWKADKETSAKIIAMLDEWYATIKRGRKLARSVGARDAVLTASLGFGALAVVGFVFKDESKVDPKQFVRLKNSSNGWRPRHGKTELAKAFEGLRSHLKSDVAKLIGMNQWDGMSFLTPGVTIHKGTACISTTEHTKKAKGCTRISDTQYEKICGEK